tara:strand:- start:898 stop:1365 length:468 start_codon:yes stop_codon:yes gene_type:complete
MASTDTRKGLTVTADGTNIDNVDILLDLDMRTGSLVDETRWLDGAAGPAGSYPGNLTGFLATNDNTINNAGGSMRMVTVRVQAGATSAGHITFSTDTTSTDGQDGTPVSKVIAIVGRNDRVAHTIVGAINGANPLKIDLTPSNAAADSDLTVLLM